MAACTALIVLYADKNLDMAWSSHEGAAEARAIPTTVAPTGVVQGLQHTNAKQ
jgi:hypothetical protein